MLHGYDCTEEKFIKRFSLLNFVNYLRDNKLMIIGTSLFAYYYVNRKIMNKNILQSTIHLLQFIKRRMVGGDLFVEHVTEQQYNVSNYN
jgi:hypothetical protein